MSKRSEARRQLIVDVWNKTGGLCWYCGVQTVRPATFTVDHVIPLRDGGADTYENLVPCCRSCNGRKRHKTVEEFRELLARRRGERFTEEQVVYLQSIGIVLPTPPFRLFWFEDNEE